MKTGSFWPKKALGYLDSNPEENVPKVLNWVRKFDKDDFYHNAYEMVEEALKDPSNNWYKLIMSLYSDIDTGVRKKMFENFLINSAILGSRQKQMRRKL